MVEALPTNAGLEHTRPLRFHKLRIAWSAVSGVLAVLFIALWLRTYWRSDVFLPRFTNGTALSRGQLYFSADCAWRDPHTRSCRLSGRTYELMIVDIWAPDDRSIDIMHYGFRLPLWPVAIALPLAAAAPWTRSLLRKQFSLRTMLVVTAVVAVILGFLVYVSKK